MTRKYIWVLLATLVGLFGVAPASADVPNPATDLDGNGVVNGGDMVIAGNCFRAEYTGTPLPPECPAGDPHPAAGGDGDWDLDDLYEVQANLGRFFGTGDTIPPVVAITTPAAGTESTRSSVNVHGTVDDGYARIELEIVNTLGTRRTQGTNGGGGYFDVYNDLPLGEGVNTLTVFATDPWGNIGSDTVQVVYHAPDGIPPTVEITGPTDGATLAATPIAVVGTIDDDTATVTVNGVGAAVAGGVFTAAGVPLAEGVNILTATAVDPTGNRASDSIRVTYEAPDITPPLVNITSPADGATLNASPIEVVGTVDDETAEVVVNGTPATLNGTTFTASGIVLTEGDNTIAATAVDPAGNTGTDTIRVVYRPAVAQTRLYFVHNDHLGTPRFLTDESGTEVWRARYAPFGEAAVDEDPDGDGNRVVFNPRFPGQYFDEESGLHYNYFRYYDPDVGRYIASDPIGLKGGLSTYVYAAANPLNYTDRLGLADDSITTRIEALIVRGDLRSLKNLSECGALNPTQQRLIQEGIRTVEIIKRTTDSPRRIADLLGRSSREINRAIERVKQTGLPRGGPIRNPDVRVDTTTGEVYPKLPGGGIGDSIGNLFDFLL